MGLMLAFKAFFKAFQEPEKAKQFVEETPPGRQIGTIDPNHLRLLSQLQQAGRFVDFLKEDLSAFTDAQVGAAARKIHQDCQKMIEELVTIRPLREEPEGAKVVVPKGYNPSEIKVVGKVKGEPPFTGVLVHKGWKAHKLSLPKTVGEQSLEILCPAEIEVR